MNYLKMLGAAAIAAVALVALVGAGSASATVLCTKTDTPCKSRYVSPTAVKGELVGSAILAETPGAPPTVHSTCTGSTLEGEISKDGTETEPFAIKITKLTWSGCTTKTETIAGGGPWNSMASTARTTAQSQPAEPK